MAATQTYCRWINRNVQGWFACSKVTTIGSSKIRTLTESSWFPDRCLFRRPRWRIGSQQTCLPRLPSGLGCAGPLPAASLQFVLRDSFWQHLLPDQLSLLGKKSYLVDPTRGYKAPEQSLSSRLTQKLPTPCFLPWQPSITLNSVLGFTFSPNSRGMWLHIKISLGWSMLVILLVCPWGHAHRHG